MAIPIRNTVFDKIKEANSLTDVELYKMLTKDERRIEVIVIEKVIDKVAEQNKEVMEKDYEASFPGKDK